MLHDGQSLRIRVSGEPHYSLHAMVIDSVNGTVKVIDTTATWQGKPVWKVWNGCVLHRPQWMKVKKRKP